MNVGNKIQALTVRFASFKFGTIFLADWYHAGISSVQKAFTNIRGT